MTSLLRGSHIKPWAACESDAERLDVLNGLLLAPNLDATFDRGLITVSNDGAVVVSDELSNGCCDRRMHYYITTRYLGGLSEDDRIVLAVFVATQMKRVPPDAAAAIAGTARRAVRWPC